MGNKKQDECIKKQQQGNKYISDIKTCNKAIILKVF